jgi:hypothetical protein
MNHQVLLLSLVILLAWVSGCSPMATPANQLNLPELSYEEEMTLNSPTPTPAGTIQTSTVISAPGLTYEEDLSINPPPPLALKATIVEKGIQLNWDLPPVVSVPHHYGDEVLYYKIFRRTETTQFVFLAKTTDLFYVDQSAEVDAKYTYTVTAMHENENESSRAQEVTPSP